MSERIRIPELKVGDRVKFRDPEHVIFLFSVGNPDPHDFFVVIEAGHDWNREEVYLRDNKSNTVRTVRRELELVETATA